MADLQLLWSVKMSLLPFCDLCKVSHVHPEPQEDNVTAVLVGGPYTSSCSHMCRWTVVTIPGLVLTGFTLITDLIFHWFYQGFSLNASEVTELTIISEHCVGLVFSRLG